MVKSSQHRIPDTLWDKIQAGARAAYRLEGMEIAYIAGLVEGNAPKPTQNAPVAKEEIKKIKKTKYSNNNNKSLLLTHRNLIDSEFLEKGEERDFLLAMYKKAGIAEELIEQVYCVDGHDHSVSKTIAEAYYNWIDDAPRRNGEKRKQVVADKIEQGMSLAKEIAEKEQEKIRQDTLRQRAAEHYVTEEDLEDDIS